MTMFQESMCQSQRNSFDQFNNYCAIDVKMDGKAVLEEKPSLTILGLSFSSTLDWVLILYWLLKPPPRQLEH